MNFHFLSDVRQADGGKLGELRHVIVDPATYTLTCLIAQQAIVDGHAVIVPMHVVSGADDDAVYVYLTDEEFKRLPPYAYGHNIAPPPADLDPANQSSEFEEDLVQASEVPPIGAASGVTSIAFTPIFEVHRNIPENSVILDDETAIIAIDGTVGNLSEVLVDDVTGNVAGIVVRTTGMFSRTFEVPLAAISDCTSEQILLSRTRAQLETA